MKNIEVRLATSDDFLAVYNLINELEDQIFDRNKQEKIYHKNLNNPDIIYFVAATKLKIVGFISAHIQLLLHHSESVAEIQELIVTKEYRSQKIGKLLLDQIILELKNRNITQLEVTSNKMREAAHQFYLREGFVDSHKKFTKVL